MTRLKAVIIDVAVLKTKIKGRNILPIKQPKRNSSILLKTLDQ
jgi:hypothetical protein